MKINKIKNVAFTTVTTVFAMMATTANAATIASDTNLKLAPTSGGMAGVGYISPQDAVASVYGNPASLTQLEGDTDFTFAATYLNVRNKVFDDDIEMEDYLLPSIAFRQRVSDKMVLGGGLNVISGLGSDYRQAASLPGVEPTVTYINFGANAAAAYELTPKTSIGASMTLAYSLLEVGLLSGAGIQEAFGVRGGVGVIHNLGPVKVGLNYNSPLEMDYDNSVRTSSGFSDVQLQQPQELILGVSSTPELWPNLMVEANLIYKNWDDADLYEDIWRDTYTLQLGGQYALTDKLKLRAGYSYTTDLLKENGLGNSLAGLTDLQTPLGAVQINPGVLQLVQATLADPTWNNNITIGLGYELTEKLSANVHAGYAWGPDRTVGVFEIETSVISAGAGLTWNF